MSGIDRVFRIALAGNPNAGKTSLFNALTGSHHKVGNYPGVTVEKREGIRDYRGFRLHIVDLPGTYSLTAYSLDEMVARDFVLGERPDLVIDVLDSTTLERSLALCLQFQELGIPLVGALNMSDEAERDGIHIDEAMLSATLGIPLIKTVGTSGRGGEALLDAAIQAFTAAENPGQIPRLPDYGAEVEARISRLKAALAHDADFASSYPTHWMAIKLLEKDSDALARLDEHPQGKDISELATQERQWIHKHFGKDPEIVITEQRYAYIRGALAEAVRRQTVRKERPSDSLDRILMHRILGLPLFFLILWSIFKLTFTLGEAPVFWLEQLIGALAVLARGWLPEGLLNSLIVDGIIGGVGGVFSFVPLIVILFFCLSILEDTGYMSRAAFLTDRILHSFGLHGQSFLPMILGFGCSVPAIMATRTLKSPKDRIATILSIPFMSCGAKLPVYVLLAGAFFPKNPGNAVMAIYGAGVLLSLISTLVLRKTVLRGATTPFVMELPPYRLPTLRGLLWHVRDKTWQYTKKAGTVILGASLFIWVLTNFPVLPDRTPESGPTGQAISAVAERTQAEATLEYSFAGRIGKFIEPAVAPLGFTWKIGVASLTGFAAKELVVSTLGILYGVGEDAAEGEGLRQALRNDPALDPLAAAVLMLVILIMPPCFAALATLRAEAGWKWLGFELIYGFGLAWIAGFALHTVGSLLGLGIG